MQSIENYDFKNKKAFVRVDFNVPMNDKRIIIDDTRIRAALPTLKTVLNGGGSLILASHLGRPKGQVSEIFSLKHIVSHLSECLGVDVKFAPDCAKASDICSNLKSGEVVLLENLRFYSEEEGKPYSLAEDATDEDKTAAKKAVKASQKEFAKTLASYADCYINDAFGTAHRAHASTAIMAEHFASENKMFGLLMEKEVSAVENVMQNTVRPFTAIMGGAKVSSKIDIIENLLTKVDHLIIGGGMTYTFIKALGGEIGASLCEDDKLELALELIEKAKANNVEIHLAEDTMVGDRFANDANTQFVDSYKIPEGWMGLDIAPKARAKFAEVIKASKTILWNGPAGVFEMETFAEGSHAVAQAIVEATAAGAYSLVGGGDSVACINKYNMGDKVSYVSTGGGALLEAIEGKTLPGIAAIQG